MQILTFLLGSLIGYTFGKIWVWATDKLKKKPIIAGCHFHHSLFFIPAFLTALFTSGNTALTLWGVGTGIIIQHTINEGFKFITQK